MIITPMSLLEYLEVIKPIAKTQKYKWIIMFIGRKADSRSFYKELQECWSSLHDLTNERIAIVISYSKAKLHSNAYYRIPGQESYIGKACAFASVLGEDQLTDIRGDICCNYFDWDKIDWADYHTQSTYEFINKHEIDEDDLPGLYVYNLLTGTDTFLPLHPRESIYCTIKEFSKRTKTIDAQITEYLDIIEYDSKIFKLDQEIREYANKQNETTKNAIISVLDEKEQFKDKKEHIPERTIRSKIKKFGQWKRQAGLDEKGYSAYKREREDAVEKIEEYKEQVEHILHTDFENYEENKMTVDNTMVESEKKGNMGKTVVFIADDWGYTFGGVNVFNIQLCEAMGKLNVAKVICVSKNANQEKRKEAASKGVELINISDDDFTKAEAILKEIEDRCGEIIPEDTVFIGHDILTGEIALSCRDVLKGSKCAIIHHMAYDEYYAILNDDTSELEKKENMQKDVMNKADYVFANGDGLLESAQGKVKDQGKIKRVYPGISDVEFRKDLPPVFRVVTFGRVEEEKGTKKNNSIVKQIYLAVAGWAKLSKELEDENTTMKVYGKSSEKSRVVKELKKLAEEIAEQVNSIAVVDYEKNRELLMDNLAGYSLCLSLFIWEGYGLTALEAVSAGVPLIVSKKSGFYKTLANIKLENYVVGVNVSAQTKFPYYREKDLDEVYKAIKKVYYNKEKVKEDILKLREKLIEEGFTWEKCAMDILETMFNMTISKPQANTKSVISEIFHAFNRPIFTTRFYQENGYIEVTDALRDVVSIINTGYEGDKKINEKCSKDLDSNYAKKISEIVNGINFLRKILNEAKEKKIIEKEDIKLLMWDPFFCSLIDTLRAEILYYARKIAIEQDIDFPCFDIGFNTDWCSLEGKDKGSLTAMMEKSFSDYKSESNYWNMFR